MITDTFQNENSCSGIKLSGRTYDKLIKIQRSTEWSSAINDNVSLRGCALKMTAKYQVEIVLNVSILERVMNVFWIFFLNVFLVSLNGSHIVCNYFDCEYQK